MANTLKNLSALLFMFLLFPLAWADCGQKETSICAAGSPWYTANVIKLALTQPGSADVSRFTLTVHEPLNLSLDVDNAFQGKTQKGTIKLIDGQAMLTQGMALEKGYEIDALDGPVLLYQLLVTLLSQAVPDGPDNLLGTQNVKIDERKRGIQIATMSASGYFAPPWSLTGTVSRTDKETVAYSLQLGYAQDGNASIMSFEGTWQKLQHTPPIDPSMPLVGWQLHRLGPVVIKQDGSTIFDYGAQPMPTGSTTLGELRKALAEENKERHKQEASPDR